MSVVTTCVKKEIRAYFFHSAESDKSVMTVLRQYEKQENDAVTNDSTTIRWPMVPDKACSPEYVISGNYLLMLLYLEGHFSKI